MVSRREFFVQIASGAAGAVQASQNSLQQVASFFNPNIDWTSMPTRADVERVLPEIYHRMTGKKLEDMVGSIEMKPWDEVRKESHENTLAYFSIRDRSMVIGLPNPYDGMDDLPDGERTIEILKEFFTRSREKKFSLIVWDSLFHELGHSDKIFVSPELNPLYEKVGSYSTFERMLLSSLLTSTKVLDTKQRSNIRRKIDVDVAVSEMYAMIFSLACQAEIEQDPEKAEVLFRQNLVSHMKNVGRAVAPSSNPFDRTQEKYDRFYLTGQYLGLVLSSRFDFDLKKTADFMAQSDIDEIVDTVIETIGIDTGNLSNNGNFLSQPSKIKFKPKPGLPVDPAARLYNTLDDAVKGISVRYGINSITGIQDFIHPNVTQHDFTEALARRMDDGVTELSLFRNDELDVDDGYNVESIIRRLSHKERTNPFEDGVFHEYLKLRFDHAKKRFESNHAKNSLNYIQAFQTEAYYILDFIDRNRSYGLLGYVLEDSISILTACDRMLQARPEDKLWVSKRKKLNQELGLSIFDFYEDNISELSKQERKTAFNNVLFGINSLLNKADDYENAGHMINHFFDARVDEISSSKNVLSSYFKEYCAEKFNLSEYSTLSSTQQDSCMKCFDIEEHESEIMVRVDYQFYTDEFMFNAFTALFQILNKRGEYGKAVRQIESLEQSIDKLEYEPSEQPGLSTNRKKDDLLQELRIIRGYNLELAGRKSEALSLYRSWNPKGQIKSMGAYPLVMDYRRAHPDESENQGFLEGIVDLSFGVSIMFERVDARDYVNWRIQEISK